MALAQQLAELALANSQGLLNDDEYRLLRQNLFEQHSSRTLIPAEAPILPIAGPGRKSSRPSTAPIPTRIRIGDTHVNSPAPGNPPLRRKASFAASVASLLRRATGAKAPPSPSSPSYDPPSTASPAESLKRGVIPQIRRKASELFSGRTEGKRHPTANSHQAPSSLSDTRHPSNTPLQSTKRTAIPTFPSTQTITSSSSDVFDDRNLHTAKDIRAAIIATESEAQRLLEAFTGLESTTSFRVHRQTARRLPSATPEHVNTLIDGTEWRNHRPPKPPSPLPSLLNKRAHRHVPPAIDTTNDNASVRSGSSSIQTSLSRSKSISSLRSKQHPASPLSARFPPSSPSIRRKNSASSISSQATQRLGAAANTSLSRSTGHLPLGMLVESEDARLSPVDRERPGLVKSHPEVSEIQRRRDEVMARYAARLEYLQARLKSAELHEKLLRR